MRARSLVLFGVVALALASCVQADELPAPRGPLPIQKVWPRSRVLSPSANASRGLIGPTPSLLSVPTLQRVPAPFATKLDVNSASLEQLQRLPGVGLAWAPKMLAGRPYKSLGDLARDGIPFNTIEQITPLITFGP